MSKLSEEEIIKYIKDEIEDETDTYHWFDDNPENKTRKQIEESINAHQGLLDLYKKEKEKNKELDKIKFIITDKLPPDMKYVCYCNTDFERLFSNDFISKDKIREFKNKFIEDSKNEKVFMTQSSQINASLIQFCNELLEERN